MNTDEEMTCIRVSSWNPTGRMPTLPEVIAHSSLTALEKTLAKGSSMISPRAIRKRYTPVSSRRSPLVRFVIVVLLLSSSPDPALQQLAADIIAGDNENKTYNRVE
ncbi:hypothetical protein D3C81_1939240 [compost metagenome]